MHINSYMKQEQFTCDYCPLDLIVWTRNLIYITFTFSHLADAFIQSDLQMRNLIRNNLTWTIPIL